MKDPMTGHGAMAFEVSVYGPPTATCPDGCGPMTETSRWPAPIMWIRHVVSPEECVVYTCGSCKDTLIRFEGPAPGQPAARVPLIPNLGMRPPKVIG